MAKKFTKRTLSTEDIKKAEELAQQIHKQESEEKPVSPSPRARKKAAPKKPSNKRVSFNVRMPEHLYDKLSSEKARTGMSRASIIYQALDLYFAQK